ncbi:MAG: response regulator [Bacteroidales bacterium]|nr:response regulator [Bacteroidales bacterium]MDD4672327.1 response regulator [Bacteroidales bacterium]MDY0349178.1 response regulator [Tenuifilaceae bacterium]
MILIVDDSTTNQVLLEAILQEEGYDTITAFGANEAFKIIEKEKPKLILLDLLMPEVSGFDFLKEVKANPKTSDIAVVVVSAVGSAENVTLCKQLGAAEFFDKPINIPVFINTIKRMVSIS